MGHCFLPPKWTLGEVMLYWLIPVIQHCLPTIHELITIAVQYLIASKLGSIILLCKLIMACLLPCYGPEDTAVNQLFRLSLVKELLTEYMYLCTLWYIMCI